jgi:hypothetical protein
MADVPGRVVAAAAEIDAALATYFQVPAGPLESQRMAEEILRRYGQREELAAAAAIIGEAAGEYRAKNVSITAHKSGGPVNKRKETGNPRFSRRNAAQSDAQ